MFGILSGVVNSLPPGRFQNVLRAKLGPPPEGPGRIEHPAWDGAKRTITMADSRLENWERILAPYKGKVNSVLEIGSYEGQSAMFWLYFFGASVTCIDPWSRRSIGGIGRASAVEARFDANLRGRATKIKSESTPALYRLGEEGRQFDLIYVDGDHSRDQVMIDSCLAWKCLRPGGLMIWDDYKSYLPLADDRDRPTPAIDFFIEMQGKQLSVLEDTGHQMLAIRNG